MCSCRTGEKIQAISDIPETNTPTPPIILDSTPTVEKSILSTATQHPSQAPSPSLTPTQLDATDVFLTEIALTLKYKCLETVNDLPTDLNLNGKLFLDPDFYFYLSTREWQKIPLEEGEKITFFEVSPNRKMAAYFKWREEPRSQDLLVIESSDGHQLSSLTLTPGKYGLEGWLDNDRLWFTYDTEYINEVMVLNPFTNDRQNLVSQYEGLKRIDYNGYPLVSTYVVYSPSLEYVLFPQVDNDNFIVLYDRPNSKKVFRIIDHTHFGHMPIWSLDGKSFFIPLGPYPISDSNGTSKNRQEWFKLSIDGRAQQLTHFADNFDNMLIGEASVSPDEHLIAFWLAQTYKEPPELTVLDLQTLEVTNYCVPGYKSIFNATAPIWSPDGRYLAIRSSVEQDATFAVIVNLMDEWAAKIGEDLLPEGWMISP